MKQFRDFNGYTQKEIEYFKIINDDEIENLVILESFNHFSEDERSVFNNLLKESRDK